MLNKRNKLILQLSAITLAFGLLLFACHGRDHTNDLKHYIEQLKANSIKHLKPNDLNIKLPAPVVYDENTLRPPFGDIPKSSQNNGATSLEQSNPLLAYSLSMLKFVGTVAQTNATVAFILAPNGMIYQVQVGSEIGDHHGKVVDIQEDKLQVMEPNTMGGNGSGEGGRIVTLLLKDEQS